MVFKKMEGTLKNWNNHKPTKRQAKIFEVLQNFGVVSKEFKHHSALVEALDEIK